MSYEVNTVEWRKDKIKEVLKDWIRPNNINLDDAVELILYWATVIVVSSDNWEERVRQTVEHLKIPHRR